MSQEKTPTVVSVINLKGGVGKTTLVALLARRASDIGLDVLAVDLDPQANLSQALLQMEYKQIVDPHDPSPSIVELFNGFAPASKDNPGPTALKTSDVVRAVRHRSAGHGQLDILPSRFDFSDNLIDSVRVDQTVLARFISTEMAHKNLVLIDCAPTESILTKTAYHASRYIFVPVRPELFSTIGFPLMKESLDKFRDDNRGNMIEVKGVLVNHTDYGTGPHHSEALADIRDYASRYEWPMLQNEMSYSRGYPKYMASDYPSYPGKAAHEQREVCDEILQSLGFSDQSMPHETDAT